MVSWSPVLHLFDCCLDSLFAWTRQDAVVGVEDLYYVFFVEYTFIDDGLFESDFFEFDAQVLVSDSSCLCLSVCILLDIGVRSPAFV